MKPKFHVSIKIGMNEKGPVPQFTFKAMNGAAQEWLDEELGLKGEGQGTEKMVVNGMDDAMDVHMKMVREGCDIHVSEE